MNRMQNQVVPDWNLETISLYNFDETVDRLRQSILTEDLLLVHEINTQQILKASGLSINGLIQLLFFAPRYMKVILEQNPAAVLIAPLKVVIMEDAAQRVTVRYPDPVYLFQGYTGLTALGNELTQLMTQVVSVVTES
jgi:uncharacterized protein (DUF302 family)